MPASSLSGLRGQADPMRIESQIELCVGVEIQSIRNSPVPRQNVVRAKHREISRRVRLKMKRELNLESSPTPRCSLPATSERIPHTYINIKGEVRAWCFRAERLG